MTSEPVVAVRADRPAGRPLLSPLRARIRQVDWRIWAIILALLFCIVVTLAGYASTRAFGLDLDPGQHFGAVFASWVGGVVLFSVAGAAVALVSVARPETDSFDSRARILFRRQTGKHIDYIVVRIKDILEHYAERHVERLVVESYHEGEKKLRVQTVSKAVIRSYIDDTDTTYTSGVRLRDLTPPPAGGARARLAYLRVDDKPVQTPFEFDGSVEREFAANVSRNSACRIEHRMDIWIQAETEDSTFEPVRYTQEFELIIENLLSRPVKISLSRDGQPPWQEHVIDAGDRKTVLSLKDIEPKVSIYAYRVAVP